MAARREEPEPFLPFLVPMGSIIATAPVVKEIAAEMAADFDTFWWAWPVVRRRDKGHARLAYAKARRLASAEEILAGAQRYALDCEDSNREPHWISHPTTWLNGERWTDEYPIPMKGGNGNGSNNHHPGAGQQSRGRADALLAAGIAAGARVRARTGHR